LSRGNRRGFSICTHSTVNEENMSFKSIMQTVENDLGIAAKDAQLFSPLISEVYPPAGAVVSTVASLVMSAELAFPATAAGATKKQSVVGDINAALPLLQAGMLLAGVKFTVTPALQSVISKTIDDVVTLLNDMAAIKAAIINAPVASAPVANKTA
jgi:hypothetical protein